MSSDEIDGRCKERALLTRSVRKCTTGTECCHETCMGHLEKMDVLSQFGDMLEAILSVWLGSCTSRAKHSLLGWAPVGVPYVVAEVSVAATTDHAIVVE